MHILTILIPHGTHVQPRVTCVLFPYQSLWTLSPSHIGHVLIPCQHQANPILIHVYPMPIVRLMYTHVLMLMRVHAMPTPCSPHVASVSICPSAILCPSHVNPCTSHVQPMLTCLHAKFIPCWYRVHPMLIGVHPMSVLCPFCVLPMLIHVHPVPIPRLTHVHATLTCVHPVSLACATPPPQGDPSVQGGKELPCLDGGEARGADVGLFKKQPAITAVLRSHSATLWV